MYKKTNIPHNSVKLMYRLTAFFAAFLLFLQPIGVLFVHAEDDLGVATETTVENTVADTDVQEAVETPAEPAPEEVATEPEAALPEPEVAGLTEELSMPVSNHNPIGINTKVDPEVDSSTGSLVYNYPIYTAPGRNNLTPELSLSYNSSRVNNTSIAGFGWNIGIQSIERLNKDGVYELYEEDNFTSSMSGELIGVDATNYVSKVESGDFISYAKSGSGWIAKDKNGTVYSFGLSAASRQDNPSDSSKVYKWMIDKIEDTNGNTIIFEYTKDNGQIYPSNISYVNDAVGAMTMDIDFTLTSNSHPYKEYKTGFAVKNNYLIDQITMSAAGSWFLKYDLDYIYSYPNNRALLSSIDTTGRDSSLNEVVQDPVEFEYQQWSSNWIEDTTWESLFPYYSPSLPVGSYAFGEINGDGLLDVLCGKAYLGGYCSNDNPVVAINNGDGWESSTFGFPEKPDAPTQRERFITSSGEDSGLRFFDVNGDNLTDFVRSTADGVYIYINNGTEWIYDDSWDIVLPFSGGNTIPGSYSFGDVNGDGLIDVACAQGQSDHFCNTSNPYWTLVNTGSGWENTENYGGSDALISSSEEDTGVRMVDVNGDGLVDFMRAKNSDNETYINTGNGYVVDPVWDSPLPFVDSLTIPGSISFGDVNGDGLIDIACAQGQSDHYCNTSNPQDIYINNGAGWSAQHVYGGPDSFVDESEEDTGVRMMDIDGDGLMDFIRSYESGGLQTDVNINGGLKTDLLKTITSSSGAVASFGYKPSTQYLDGSGDLLNSTLPITVDTVNSITTDDGFGNESTETYTYADGFYYFNTPHDRKFAGFGLVEKTDEVGNITKTYFHQGNGTDTANGEYDDHISKVGRPYRIEEYNDSDDLYKLTVNKLDKYNIGTNHDFVKLTRSTVLNYDGDADHKDTATEYTYDNANGNLLTNTNWGEVTASTDGSFTDTGSDKSTETITYASNVGANILGLTSQITAVDQSANKVNETKYFYDNQTFGNVTDGNITKEQKWVTGTTYQTWKKSYNANGTVATETDPRNKVTTYTTYDSYGLYPLTITNPLSQATTYSYDYSSGSAIEATDSNGSKIEKVLDGFDRPLEEKISDPTSGSQVTKTTYAYNDASFPHSVTKNDYLDSTIARTSYSYIDGFGRTVQVRTEMEDSGDYSVKDTVYNELGLVEKESLPYTDTGTSYESPTGTASLYTNYTYDALKRPLTIVNNLGTTTNSYDQWMTTTTDPLGKVKDYINDARGNLTSVIEHDGASSYTTNYEWNLNGMLTKITDSLSNIRNFTYDGIGNRLSAEDLHAVGDTTFGAWTYSYDASGNMAQSVSPKGDTVNYTYDDINRQLTENWTGGTGTEITYTYDSCTEGIGYLCSATVLGGVATTYVYTPNGLIKSDTRTISGTGYTTSRIYDRQGSITQMQLPDSSQMRYTFNSAGLKETMQRKEVGGSWTNVLTDVDYAPTDQVKYLAYQNGVTTTNTFDSTKLYRLTNKVTAKTGGSTFQSIAYTYDTVGNITNLVDSGATGGAKTFAMTYDNLHRLTYINATSLGTGTAYNQTFAYNSIGNITSVTGTGGTVYPTTQYNGSAGSSYANPHAATKIGGVNRVYDQNGNMLGNGALTNTWNYKNELTQTVVGANTMSYTYDHSGDRMTYVNPTATTITPSKEYEVTGTLKKKSLYLGDELIATIEDNAGTITPHYAHTDHLFGSSVMTSSTGTQDELVDYYPFGEGRVDTLAGSFKERHKFTGHLRDEDTGLEYAKARYLNTKYNRFISQDKQFWATPKEFILDPQMWNSYSYARNNPFKYADPTGEKPIDYVGSALLSIGENTVNTVAGTVNAVFHPVAAAKAIGNYIKNLPETVHNIPQTVQNVGQDFKSASDVGRGDMIGSGIFFVGTMGIGGEANIAKGLRLGEGFGSLGRVVENRSAAISGFTEHGLNQTIQRGVSPQALLNTVKNPLVTLEQKGGTTYFLTQDAAVVLNNVGKIVTTYTNKEFNTQVSSLLKKALSN